MVVLFVASLLFFSSFAVGNDTTHAVSIVLWTIFVAVWVLWHRSASRVRVDRPARHPREWRREIAQWFGYALLGNLFVVIGANVSWVLAGLLCAHEQRSGGDRRNARRAPPVSVADLDPLIHAPKRLGAMAILATAKWVEFSFLREQLDVSDSDLSKQMTALTDAGYAKVRKNGHGRGSTTWFAITPSGRSAFDGHVAALRALVEQAPVAPN